MEDILLGGERELQELKKALEETKRYKSVIKSLDADVDEQLRKIEDSKEQIRQEVMEEELKRKDEVTKPFYDEMANCEVEKEKVKEARNARRLELIDKMVKEEAIVYEERKGNLENQIKQVRQEENVPSVCMSRLFLAFFCPRTGKDALILILGIVLLLLVFPMFLYFGIYGGNDRAMLTAIYLVLIIFFYTAYLLINNMVKDKYLVGLNKILKLQEEEVKLELHRKQRVKELENISDKELDLKEFDNELLRLQAVIDELNGQKNIAIANFDSDIKLKNEMIQQVQERHKSEQEQMQLVLKEAKKARDDMKLEFDKFVEDKNIDDRFYVARRLESDLYNESVIDELIFYISQGEAENIRGAIMRRKKRLGQVPNLK